MPVERARKLVAVKIWAVFSFIHSVAYAKESGFAHDRGAHRALNGADVD
jgi:hypothetical protein